MAAQRFLLILLAFGLNGMLTEINGNALSSADSREMKTKPTCTVNSLKCKKGAVDLALVIDESSSISHGDYYLTLLFLANLTDTMDIGPAMNQSQVALVTFSSSAKLAFNLKRPNGNKKQLRDDILNLMKTNEGTDIASGMNLATTKVFTPTGGDRSDVQNVMIVLTDGEDNTDVTSAQKAAAAKNITVYVIAIGNAVNEAQLEAIVGGSSTRVYNVSGFNVLNSLLSEVCIGTLDESENCESSILPALIAIPLGLIILAAICLIIVLLWKRSSRMKLTAVLLDDKTSEMSLLSSETAEREDVNILNDIQPTALATRGGSGKTPAEKGSQTDAEKGSQTDKVGHPKSAVDSSRTAASSSHVLLPPNLEKLHKANSVSISITNEEGSAETAEKQPELSERLTDPLPAFVKVLQEAERIMNVKTTTSARKPLVPPVALLPKAKKSGIAQNSNSNVEVINEEGVRQQALLPPLGRRMDNSSMADRVHSHESNWKSDINVADVMQTPLSSSSSAERSRGAEVLRRQDSNADSKAKNTDGQQTLLQSTSRDTPKARRGSKKSSLEFDTPQAQDGVASDGLNSRKTAVAFRKGGPVAFDNARIQSSEGAISSEDADYSKSAAIQRLKQGNEIPSAIFESNANFGEEKQPKYAEIVQRQSAACFNVS